MHKINLTQVVATTTRIVALSLPICIGRIISLAAVFVAMLLVASISPLHLSAGALIANLSTTIFVIGWSILFAMSILMSAAIGRKCFSEVGVIFVQGLILAILISLFIMVAFLLVPSFLSVIHQPPAIVALVKQYFNILLWGILPATVIVCQTQYFASIERPIYIVILSVAEVLILSALGYLLVKGKWGLPALGIRGVAYAFSAMNWLVCLGGMVYLFLAKWHRSYALFKVFHKQAWQYMRRIVQLGWPICAQFAVELLALTTATLLIGYLGSAALGAQQIVYQINLIALMIPYSIAQAATILVANSKGSNNPEMIWQFSVLSVLIGTLVMLVVGGVYVFSPMSFIALYINPTVLSNQSIVDMARHIFIVYAISQFFNSIRIILTGSLRGLEDTKMPMLATSFLLWLVGLPMGCLLGFHFKLGPAGVNAGFILAYLLNSIYLWFRFVGLFSSKYSY